jgi:hypothetical protein
MNKLDELEQLATAERKRGEMVEKHLGYKPGNEGSYVVRVSNETLLALIALVREMGEALEGVMMHEPSLIRVVSEKADTALTKYEEWKK